jgi:hypothetical protein
VSVAERDGQGTIVYNGTINVRPESGLSWRAEYEGGVSSGRFGNDDLQKSGKTLRESQSRENEGPRSSAQRQEHHNLGPAMQRALAQFNKEQGPPGASLPYKTTDRTNERKL